MNVRIEGTAYSGRAIDLSARDLDPGTVAAAVRGHDSETVSVASVEPDALGAHVGLVEPGMGIETRSALAAVARSLGLESTRDGKIETLKTRLATLEGPPTVDHDRLETIRRRRRDATQNARRLSERFETIRKRHAERSVAHPEVTTEREGLRSIAASLSEAETDRIAAEQLLDRYRKRQRRARDRHERRLELVDRLENAERVARRELAASVRDRVRKALAAIPEERATSLEGTRPVGIALAAARVAAIEFPVVLDCDRFESASEATRRLDVPVIRF